MGEVLPLGDEALMELAGEQGDAVHPGVMAEPVAGHADLAAAGRQQNLLVQVGPLLDRQASIPFGQCRGAAQMHAHGLSPMRTHVLARVGGFRAATENGGDPASAALVPPSDHYRRICAEMGAWPLDDHPPTETGRSMPGLWGRVPHLGAVAVPAGASLRLPGGVQGPKPAMPMA